MEIIAEIATAFPGLFSYRDLLNLDLRDLRLWRFKAREANLIKNTDRATKRLDKKSANRRIGQAQFSLRCIRDWFTGK